MKGVNMETNDKVNLRYMVKDVEASIQFYTQHLGFTLLNNFAPAFADMVKGNLRLLLSGSTSSAGRNMPDGVTPTPGGWNRFQVIVSDIDAEVVKLKGEGLKFRNEIVKGPGGSQILLIDPSGNLVEIFEPAQQ
jgi:catechol 2,3-dioxygenase-like lactoylglutathione lyase family enzyme